MYRCDVIFSRSLKVCVIRLIHFVAYDNHHHHQIDLAESIVLIFPHQYVLKVSQLIKTNRGMGFLVLTINR